MKKTSVLVIPLIATSLSQNIERSERLKLEIDNDASSHLVTELIQSHILVPSADGKSLTVNPQLELRFMDSEKDEAIHMARRNPNTQEW